MESGNDRHFSCISEKFLYIISISHMMLGNIPNFKIIFSLRGANGSGSRVFVEGVETK